MTRTKQLIDCDLIKKKFISDRAKPPSKNDFQIKKII